MCDTTHLPGNEKKLIVTGFVAHYTEGNSSWYCKTGQRPKADEVIGCSGKATAVVFDKQT